MAKFTFKKEPRAVGPARGASRGQASDIKLGGKLVGSISPPHWSDNHSDWKVRFMVVDPESRSGWRHTVMKRRFANGDEAREWVKLHEADIQSALVLFLMDD